MSKKTYTLRCTYMGRTVKKTGIEAAEFADTLSREIMDVDSDFTQTDERGIDAVWKWSGNFISESELRSGRVAWETGILIEGLSATGCNKENFDSINQLLADAGRTERLVMIDDDYNVTEDESEANWGYTLDKDEDTPNAQILKELDSAEWELIEE